MENENLKYQTANNDKGDVTGSSLPVIYGILEEPSRFGVQAYAIDGQTGEVIDQHFCSSEGFAKSDLGFTDPLMIKWDSFSDETYSTVHFNAERKKKYLEIFPNGYTMLWVGYWQNNSEVVRLREQQAKNLH